MSDLRFLMCPPAHFGVEYVINPWMQGQIHATNNGLASRQWVQLHDILSRYAQVESLPAVRGLPDLVFTANAAVIYKQNAILSSFRFPERQAEERYFAEWLRANGFVVHVLPREVQFEGAGDALLDREAPLLWLGYGMRSSLEAKAYLERLLQIEVQPLELCDPRFYHLDTCFCPLEGGYLLYYAGAFREDGQRAIEERIPAEKRLAVSTEDALHFTCNAVNVGEEVILNEASDETIRWLRERGFRVTKTPLSEFMRAGGAAKCLSLRLDEEPVSVIASK
jgi:N-dimethylarginine dimethylaminohydrolase